MEAVHASMLEDVIVVSHFEKIFTAPLHIEQVGNGTGGHTGENVGEQILRKRLDIAAGTNFVVGFGSFHLVDHH